MSWEELLVIFAEARATAEAELAAPPVDCPNDGTLLRTGPDRDPRLFCPFCGWKHN